jgi:hypothetical protein
VSEDEVISGSFKCGELTATDTHTVEWGTDLCELAEAASAFVQIADPPFPYHRTHWRREGPQRQLTDSDLRAFQKRVEKRRAKKKRK